MTGTAELTEIYAEALLASAAGHGLEKRVEEDAGLIAECLTAAPELHRRLCMPSVSRNEKLRVLKKVFDGHLCELTLRCMELLLKRGRASLLPQLHAAILRVRQRSAGVTEVEVTSAAALDERQRRLFEEKIGSEFGPACRISYSTDSGLIGGFTIRTPERLVDHSVRNSLEQLREQLLTE